jgi:3-isopropylmalate dehydrogenase
MAGWSAVIGNRTRLDLFANIRPVKLYEGVGTRIHGRLSHPWDPAKVDMVIVRENTEGLYIGAGAILAPGGRGEVAVDTRVITRKGSERVIRCAFELARGRSGAPADGKKRVTAILKDNVLKGCVLFGEVFREVGREYPNIEQETNIVDSFTQWLMTQPERYDVCVTTNMFGDIVTDLAAVLQGGMGLAVGCNVGEKHGMFEPIHGSAPQFTGQDKLNPLAMILAVKEGLAWLGRTRKAPALDAAAASIEAVVRRLLATGGPRTADIAPEGQASSMSAVGDAVVTALAR